MGHNNLLLSRNCDIQTRINNQPCESKQSSIDLQSITGKGLSGKIVSFTMATLIGGFHVLTLSLAAALNKRWNPTHVLKALTFPLLFVRHSNYAGHSFPILQRSNPEVLTCTETSVFMNGTCKDCNQLPIWKTVVSCVSVLMCAKKCGWVRFEKCTAAFLNSHVSSVTHLSLGSAICETGWCSSQVLFSVGFKLVTFTDCHTLAFDCSLVESACSSVCGWTNVMW